VIRQEDLSMSVATTSPSRPASIQESDANRQVAIDFITQAAAGHARDVMRRYAAADFVHHNPWFASDSETLATAMDDNYRENPSKRFEILRTIAEGPLVALHGRVQHKPDEDPAAVIHIFRIEDGRIHELWDVGQDPVKDSPNRAGLF
jgi:predicted SnoaL-like aldol condensation-catalyzing enzyme